MYDIGIIVGRFQGFHIGHQSIIKAAVSTCRNVILMIGSSDKKGTRDNPFPYELRKKIISAWVQKMTIDVPVLIVPLPDAGLGNCPEWGNYLLNTALKYIRPENISDTSTWCMVVGSEAKYDNWFANHPEMDIIRLDRSDISISGTKLRQYILNGDKPAYDLYTGGCLSDYYEELRICLLQLQGSESGS